MDSVEKKTEKNIEHTFNLQELKYFA